MTEGGATTTATTTETVTATTDPVAGADPLAPAQGQAAVGARAPARRHRRPGTATRLAVVHGGILAVILCAVVLALVHTFAGQSDSSTTRLLTAEVNDFRIAANARPPGETLVGFARSYLRTQALPNGQFVVVGFPGRRSLGSEGSAQLARTTGVAGLLADPPSRSVSATVQVGSTTYDVLAVPVLAPAASATFVVAADQSEVRRNESRVLRLALVEALIALLAGTVAGYLLLRGLLRRIGGITDIAAELGRGELDQRLGDQGTDDEVGQLAATFDAMADRVAAAIGAQRRLLADVSHQLRTPLTIARGHLEVLERTGAGNPAEVDETVSVVIDELDHMTALVEQLLMLGRALEPDFVASQPIDLRSFILDVYAAATVLAERHWTTPEAPDITFMGSSDLIRGAMLTLIDNAVNATSAGDRIEVGAAARVDGWLELSVSDSGPGIAVHQRLEVLDRFRRLGAADTRGTGLGLAITKAVAEAHGGRVSISDSPLGGAKVTMLLPLGPAPQVL